MKHHTIHRVRGLALIVMALALLLGCAVAQAEPARSWSARSAVDDGLDSGDRFEDYISGLFGLEIPKPARKSRASGVELTGDIRIYYDFLKGCIQEVAAGERTSTRFTFDGGFTLDQAGVNRLLSTLLADCPYELYWFDKTQGYGIGSNGYQTDFCFHVNAEYAAGEYEVNPTAIRRAKAAVANVDSILSGYASSSDYEKLLGYKNTICDLVSYNTPAAEDPDSADSNAWQLVWVFDGDSSTNVVCEGYSKAFQYLCDRTHFSGGVNCCSVTGTMSGGTGAGAHMWNLVHMPNGKNYLADITNCDSGSVGADDLLFMAGYTSGSVAEGYIFSCEHGGGSSSDIGYAYDSETLGLYSSGALTVADLDFLQDWDAPTYAWAEDYSSVTATRVREDGSLTQTETVYAVGEVLEPPTCEDAGKTIYTSEPFANAAFEVQTILVEGPEALGHDWGEPRYTWSADNTNVTASHICRQDEAHVEDETVSVTSEITRAATCEGMGETTYTSEVFENAAFSVQTKTLEDVPALGHDWGEPRYTWSADNTNVNASHICRRDEAHVESETVTATGEITKPAACEVMGETTYTTGAFGNAAFEAQVRAVTDVPALGHDWGEATYTWNADNSQVAARRTCLRDSDHVEQEIAATTAEVTKQPTFEEKGETTYTAVFENEAFETQRRTVADIDKLDYHWGPASYVWSGDGRTVTATRVSAADPDQVQTETVTAVGEVTREATCEQPGETTYTAAFENEAFSTQVRAMEDIPALGHVWGEAAYEWSEDGMSVTAGRICQRDGRHAESETVDVTAEITRPATCVDVGERTYTSDTFENAAFTVQVKVLEDVPALGHDWGEAAYVWSEDGLTVTASRVCARDETHLETETARVASTLAFAPTSDERGSTAYTAEFDHPAFAAQTRVLPDIPALSELDVLMLPAELKRIDEEAFAGLGCQAVILPEGCEKIGPEAFAGCEALIYVRIPATVTAVAEDAFSGCPNVRIDWVHE